MPNTTALKTAILYQNSSKTITLIDIPTSISLAQGTPESPNPRILHSSPPLQFPYASTEPKTEAAKAKLRNEIGSIQNEVLLVEALKQIGDSHIGEWCLPREVSDLFATRVGEKRKTRPMATSDEAASAHKPNLKMSNITHSKMQEHEIQSPLKLSIIPPYSTATALDMQSISHQLVQNTCSTQIPLHISLISQTYMIPPHGSFLLASVDGLSFHNFSRAAYEVYPTSSSSAGPGQFDFILLDPPWNNRSVHRSRKYATLRQEMDPLDVLHGMLGEHIAPGALVGCWITNKPSVRTTAVEAFEHWGVDLIEEWVWLKTTVRGEPVTRVDGLWRKPYEVLLLGRNRGADACKCESAVDVGEDMLRRVLVAVPDLHSRKPNLKELVESMIPNQSDLRALEIFARNLTAGWWSWGDEVLKFNWEGYWSKGK